MNEEQFLQLIEKHEQTSKRNPQGYRIKVLAWIFLGYGVFIGTLLLSLGLLAFSVFWFATEGFRMGAINLLLITLPLSFFMIRALRVKTLQPKGIVLKPEDAPVLFSTLDELTAKMKAPKFDTVILNDEWNASVESVSKSALPGLRRHVLNVGLPMLIGLDDQQVKAVLAHEISHISGKDTTLGSWVYRVVEQWRQLLEYLELDESDWEKAILRKFVRWYYPRFFALTFVMRRQQEYIADANAAQATSPQTVADCLIMNHAGGGFYYQEFLPDVIQKAEQNGQEPRPLTLLYERMAEISAIKERLEEHLRKSSEEETQYSDSHPSLSDRLAALGCRPVLPSLSNRAVDVYFKNGAEWVRKVEEFLNFAEVTGELTNFEEAYEEAKKVKVHLQEEEEKARILYQELLRKPQKTVEESYQFAQLAFLFDGPQAGVKALQQIVTTFKDPAQTATAYFSLGQIFLDLDEADRAAQFFERAGDGNYQLRAEAYELLISYFNERENEKMVAKYERKLERWEELLALSDEECEEDFDGMEELLPHGLSPNVMETIREDMKKLEEVKALYIARRQLEHIPQRRCYFIVVEPQKPLSKKERSLLTERMDDLPEKWLGDDDYHMYILDDEELLEPFVEASHACVYGSNT